MSNRLRIVRTKRFIMKTMRMKIHAIRTSDIVNCIILILFNFNVQKKVLAFPMLMVINQKTNSSFLICH